MAVILRAARGDEDGLAITVERQSPDGGFLGLERARAATDYRKLDSEYGIRPGIDRIIPPK